MMSDLTAMLLSPTTEAEVLENLFSIPAILRFRKSPSLMSVVTETGYLRFRNSIDVQSIKAAMRERNSIVDEWLSYSRNKKENWGWFIEGPDQGFYIVGARSDSLQPWIRVKSAEQACAHFIKGEVEAILHSPR